MAADPATLCVCGHEYRRHFGPGPCIAGTPSGEASVCACVRYMAKVSDLMAALEASLTAVKGAKAGGDGHRP